MKINNDHCDVHTIYVTHLYFENEEKAKRFVKFEYNYNIKHVKCSRVLSDRGRKISYRGENPYKHTECPYEVTYEGDASDVFERFEQEELSRIGE